MNDEMYFWHADNHWSFLYVAIILGVHSQACSKCPKLVCISVKYLQKDLGDEVDFLPSDNCKSFWNDDSMTLGVCSRACPKFPN